jgi:hypothetical protein
VGDESKKEIVVTKNLFVKDLDSSNWLGYIIKKHVTLSDLHKSARKTAGRMRFIIGK